MFPPGHDPELVHRIQDAPLRWLESVARVRQSPGNNHRHRVIEKRSRYFFCDVDRLYFFVGVIHYPNASDPRLSARSAYERSLAALGMTAMSTRVPYTSRFRTFRALSSMNWRRGSTTSPIKMVNILSASTALSSLRSTFSNLRFSGFIVVSNSSLAFISPRPLKRLICTPRRPISKIFCKISGMEKSG